MRSSEEMAYAAYLADYNALPHERSPEHGLRFERPGSWDELTEEEQATYLRHVNAILEHLFEHGRISAYVNSERLEAFSREYKTYLEQKRGDMWEVMK